MSEHTYTTDDVRDYFSEGHLQMHDGFRGDGEGSFDNWHQAELRRAKAEAWREGHDAGWTAHYNGDDLSVYRNPYRADQIEEATNDHP